VTNSHKGIQFLRLQTLAMLGYVVLAFDCRGSFHRGKQFESHLKSSLVSFTYSSVYIKVLDFGLSIF
jgi:hypothetical protein